MAAPAEAPCASIAPYNALTVLGCLRTRRMCISLARDGVLLMLTWQYEVLRIMRKWRLSHRRTTLSFHVLHYFNRLEHLICQRLPQWMARPRLSYAPSTRRLAFDARDFLWLR